MCLSFLRSCGASQLVMLMAAVMARRRLRASWFLTKRLTGVPIMTATRSTVSNASAGWRAHHLSILTILLILVVRTVRFASEMGRSLSHFVKAQTARVLGSHWLVVVGTVRRQQGSKAGGLGVLELCRRARVIGEAAGLPPVWLDRGGFGVSGFSPRVAGGAVPVDCGAV